MYRLGDGAPGYGAGGAAVALPLLVLPVLLSSPARAQGFEHVRDADGCAIAMRAATDTTVAAMRAECRWPDVQPAALAALIADYARYPDLVFPIDEARVVRVEGERTLVYQRQSGLSDREVLLWMTTTTEGAKTTVSWSPAREEPLELRPGAIRTPENTGAWSVEPDEGGGAKVVHEIALDAGGSVPQWIVGMVRTRSFAKIMSDVRAAARAVEPGG